MEFFLFFHEEVHVRMMMGVDCGVISKGSIFMMFNVCVVLLDIRFGDRYTVISYIE